MWSPWHGFWMTSVLGKDWILQINNTEGSMQSNMAYSVASHWFVLNLNREGALAASADELLWVSMTNAIRQHQTSLQMDSILSVYRLHNGEGEKQNARHLISFSFFWDWFFIILNYVCVHGRVRACLCSASREQKQMWILWNWSHRCLWSIWYGGWELNSRLLQEQQVIINTKPSLQPPCQPHVIPDS